MREVVAVALVVALGCGAKTDLSPGDLSTAHDAGPETLRDSEADATISMTCFEARAVDMLIVTDASGSMIDEIREFGDRFEGLVQNLLTPPDADGDGTSDWPAVHDLHIGFTSTALNGVLHTSGDGPGCEGPFPRFLSYRSGDNVDEFIRDATCLSTPPTSSFATEELFSSALRAILPSDTSYPLAGPLGDSVNAGLVREDSVLVVLFLTDEDDLSTCRSGDCDSICSSCDVIGSVAEYSEAFRLVRESDEILMGVIAGMPDGVVDPEEVLRISQSAPRTRPICNTFLRSGLPAPRVIGVAIEFEPFLESLCTPDFSGIAQRLAERIGRAACRD